MECAAAGFWEPPTAIPMDATEVYLPGNKFEILGKGIVRKYFLKL